MAILVTGGAGFIGSHLCESLLTLTTDRILCCDNFDPFYDISLKKKNLSPLLNNPRFRFIEADIRNPDAMDKIFSDEKITEVVHLAAKAGVRPSIQDPLGYVDTNIHGTVVLLELAKKYKISKFLFASSSSVYGNNQKVPFSETDNVDTPISPYAATKKAGELLCFNYHHLYQIPIVCLRFFTVYGPRQRPEMAIHKFARLMQQGREIPLYNYGKCHRDYTYVTDIVDGILTIFKRDFTYDVVNLGESATTTTLELIALLEQNLGVTAKTVLLPPEPGDVDITYADIERAKSRYGYAPKIPIALGIEKFSAWVKLGL